MRAWAGGPSRAIPSDPSSGPSCFSETPGDQCINHGGYLTWVYINTAPATPAAGAVLPVCKAAHSTAPVALAGIYYYLGCN